MASALLDQLGIVGLVRSSTGTSRLSINDILRKTRGIWKVRPMPAMGDRRAARGRSCRAPAIRTSPVVGAVDAADAVHQRGLAGAVHADDAQHLAGCGPAGRPRRARPGRRSACAGPGLSMATVIACEPVTPRMPDGRRRIVPTRIRKPTICAMACGRNTVASCSARPIEDAGDQRADRIAEPAQHHDDEADDGVFGAGEGVEGREHQRDQHAGDAGQAGRQGEGEGRQLHDVDARRSGCASRFMMAARSALPGRVPKGTGRGRARSRR